MLRSSRVLFSRFSAYSRASSCIVVGNIPKLNVEKRFYCEHKEDVSQENVKQKMKQNSPIGAIATRTFGLLLLCGVVWYIRDQVKKVMPSDQVADVKVKTEGEINIGAPFTLVDHEGIVRDSKKDFGGKFMLIYFGFTYCPDICPTELTKMAEVMNRLEELDKSDYVTPIMITVDPYRDTVDQIRSYVNEFHPKLVGLTGTPAEIKQVAKDFKIYNFVPENAGEEDYLVDHSVFTFLMGPNGGYLDFFGPEKTEEIITERILERISDLEDEKNPPSLFVRISRKLNEWKEIASQMI